jgi:hypothetical protein
MRQPPHDVVASWPAPNYINPETRGPALVIVELFTVSISTICLGLRLHVKARIMRSVDWDDWLIVGAAVGIRTHNTAKDRIVIANSLPYIQLFGAGVTICVVLASSRYGWDIHIWDLDHRQMVASRQVSFAAQILFILATVLAKISMFVSYLRLAPRGSWFRCLTSTSCCPGLQPVRDSGYM